MMCGTPLFRTTFDLVQVMLQHVVVRPDGYGAMRTSRPILEPAMDGKWPSSFALSSPLTFTQTDESDIH
jgi:hypothetical protein